MIKPFLFLSFVVLIAATQAIPRGLLQNYHFENPQPQSELQLLTEVHQDSLILDAEASEEPRPEETSPTPQPSRPPIRCNGIRNRKEIRDMTEKELNDWQQANLQLRNEVNDEGLSIYDELVILHASFLEEAHNGAYFLPWHRLFLFALENELRRFQPDLTLPYWDWGHDAADPALSPVWGPNVAGGADAGSPILTGAFANIRSRWPFNNEVTRDFTSGRSGALPQFHDTRILNSISELETVGDFFDALEVCHNIVHSEIGGYMRFTSISPNDPVFFLHHAFVDYVWYKRQLSKGFSEFGGTHTFDSIEIDAERSFVLQAFNATVKNVLDLDCINYVAPSFKERMVSPASNRAAPRNPCNDPNILAGIGLDAKRCRHGEEVLKNIL